MVILLTATINTRETAYIARRDTNLRLNDYKSALVRWLQDPASSKIVFCENSCSDLTELERTCSKNNPDGKEVEFLSFEGNAFPPHLGKGVGELLTIGHALTHSLLMKTDPKTMKVTGRLYVKNAAKIIPQIESRPATEIFCDLRGNLTWGDSRAFCTSTRFLEKYLMPLQNLSDDSQGIYVEHVLGRAVHQALADGCTWAMMPSVPDLRGISGSGGIAYRGYLPERIARRVFLSVKSLAFSR